MKKTVVVGLFGCSILLVSLGEMQPLGAQGNVNASHRYPPEIVNQLVQSCIEQKSSNNIPQTVVATACQCIVQQLQQAYTLEQFYALSESLQQGQQPPAQFAVIEQRCRVSVSQ